MERISYGGWENCYRLANETIELIVTTDVGPRIILFGFIGKQNLFKQYPDQMGITDSNEWLTFGGHRLWHAPEAQPRTYYPDVEPVLIQEVDNGFLLTQKPEPTTGIQKQIKITLLDDKPEVNLVHTLINHNQWAIEAAPWSISVMAPGGTAILPLPPRGPHPENILPTSRISIWPYTDLGNPCYTFFEKYILVRQEKMTDKPQKIGIFAPDGWAAYAVHECLFVKQVPFQFDGIYPDMGVNFEVFTNHEMLELETLGPMEAIPPKGKIVHPETWTLIRNVPQPETQKEIDKNIIPQL